jgi:hypothetical protein
LAHPHLIAQVPPPVHSLFEADVVNALPLVI